MSKSQRSPQSRRGRGQAAQDAVSHRLRRLRTESAHGKAPHRPEDAAEMRPNAVLNCGWGRLIFGQTFSDHKSLIEALREERPDSRDIALYVYEPQVALANAPQDIFLDPSHTYRLELARYRPSRKRRRGFFIRRVTTKADADAINNIYMARGMVPAPPEFFWEKRDARAISYFIAEDEETGDILGTVTGVDHGRAFGDPERGSSLWCLAVDPQARPPGIGEALVRHLAEHFKARGAAFMDLSVMHDNAEASALYEKLGFRRVSVFAIKRKNPINETLFTGPKANAGLNPYAKLIVDEARRRGIAVKLNDAEGGFFTLSYGGREIRCRESLSEFTSAVAMSICDDKAVTRRIVSAAGVKVPDQIDADQPEAAISDFLESHARVVVKPARGEQGRGIAVGLADMDAINAAISEARRISDKVLIEEQAEGDDLRLVVINFQLVAAALRRPAEIVGDDQSTIESLIKAQSRRRAAATGGESKIPLDEETARTVRDGGYEMDDTLKMGERLKVRRTANLHTGGTLHDVTERVHPRLVDAAIAAARAIDIPVTGIDFMVPSPTEPNYAFVEANERPGLANHEPQPTAERFIDLLFPLSVSNHARDAQSARG